MKSNLLLLLCLVSQGFSQDAAEPLNAGLLLDQKSRPTEVVLPDLFRMVGDAGDFDLIVIVYGEHIQQATVVGLKGVKTGIISFEGDKKSFSELVYIPNDSTNTNMPANRIVFKQDPKKYEKLLNAAWVLLSNPKSQIGIQGNNLNKENPAIETCFYLVSSRIFGNSASVSMIGGYVQNPSKGTKSQVFLKMVHDMVNESAKGRQQE